MKNIIENCSIRITYAFGFQLTFTRDIPTFIVFYKASSDQLYSSKRMLAFHWCNGATFVVTFDLFPLPTIQNIRVSLQLI